MCKFINSQDTRSGLDQYQSVEHCITCGLHVDMFSLPCRRTPFINHCTEGSGIPRTGHVKLTVSPADATTVGT